MQLGAYSLNVSLRMVDPELVSLAHQAGLQIYVYTVNEPQDIEQLRSWGVDGVFSDFPDRVMDNQKK